MSPVSQVLSLLTYISGASMAGAGGTIAPALPPPNLARRITTCSPSPNPGWRI